MKLIRKSIVFGLLSLFLLTSCNSSNNKNGEILSSDIESQEITTDSIETPSVEKNKHPVGEAYEVGVTPDDYSMDYDTSRLKDLNSKKSTFYPEDGVKGLYFNTYNIVCPELIEH